MLHSIVQVFILIFHLFKLKMSVFNLQVSEGLTLRDGTRLKYPINGIYITDLYKTWSLQHIVCFNFLALMVHFCALELYCLQSCSTMN